MSTFISSTVSELFSYYYISFHLSLFNIIVLNILCIYIFILIISSLASCFQSFSENENECPACLPNNKKLLDIIKAQEQSRDLHETFHSLLDRAEDPFSLVADYFGRGVFKKLMVITDTDKSLTTATKLDEPKLNYGPGAEARLRLNEGKSSISGRRLFIFRNSEITITMKCIIK